jgi:hypothetical protein
MTFKLIMKDLSLIGLAFALVKLALALITHVSAGIA